MKVSCIIPTCDRNQLLLESIESVLDQSRKPDEIIIVNNGRGAVALPADHMASVSIFNIVPYAGAAQARNFGACVATGDILAFLDDDDLWDKQYLARATEAIEHGVGCAISRLDELTKGVVRPYKNAHSKLTFGHLFIRNPGVNGSNIVIRKELFFQVGGYDPRLPTSEDKSIVIEIIKSDQTIVTLPENQAIFRQHDNGPRLTDAQSMHRGIREFTAKYASLMTFHQRVINEVKICRYRRISGDPRWLLPYLFYTSLHWVLRILRID